MLSEDTKQLKGRDLLIKFTYLFLLNNYKFDRDEFTKDIADNCKTKYIINTIFELIKKYHSNSTNQEMLESLLYGYKKVNFTMENYSYDDAFNILVSKSNSEQTLQQFSKIMMLSDDYLNIERLLQMRTRILSSEHLKFFHKYFGNKDINKKITSLFFSDYKLLIPMLNKDLSIYYTGNEDFSKDCDFLMLLFYGKFILNMASCIYTARLQYDYDGNSEKEKLVVFDKKYPIDIIFNKFGSLLDYKIFTFVSDQMEDYEILWFIIRKIYEDVLFHEQNSTSLEKMTKIYSLIIAMNQSINSTIHNHIIDEMSKNALEEWLNGSKLNHIEIMNNFFHNPKYHDILLEPGVRKDLIEKLIQICDEHGFKLIQGKHPGLHRAKDEALAEIKRLKKLKKNSSAS